MSGQGLFEPLLRLKAAIDSLDPRAAEVLAFHAAIERELDLTLAVILPRAARLHGLGYGQKVSVWAAAQKFGDEESLDVVVAVMLRFNDLRNSIAHGDGRKKVDAAVERLLKTIPEDAPHKERRNIGHAAGFIFGALNGSRRSQASLNIPQI